MNKITTEANKALSITNRISTKQGGWLNSTDKMLDDNAKRVLILEEVARTVKENPEFWCHRCNWTGDSKDSEWTEGTHEHPHDKDPFCPKCGRTDDGFPIQYVDEFVAHEYASTLYSQAESI